MIKHFCNICKKEIPEKSPNDIFPNSVLIDKENYYISIVFGLTDGYNRTDGKNFELCSDCKYYILATFLDKEYEKNAQSQSNLKKLDCSDVGTTKTHTQGGSKQNEMCPKCKNEMAKETAKDLGIALMGSKKHFKQCWFCPTCMVILKRVERGPK